MSGREPVLVAHRGYAAKYPENTIEACQAAVDAGCRWVEVDVQMRGSVPVLSHDIPAAEPCQRLSDFAEWLESHPDVTALVDLKTESLVEYGRREVVQAVIDVMRGNWHPISFDHRALEIAVEMGALEPGLNVCSNDPAVRNHAVNLGVRWLIINQIFIPAHGLPAGPWDWIVYEIATVQQARDMLARGVHWMETMDYVGIRDGLGLPCSP